MPFFKDVFLPLAKAYALIRSGGEGVHARPNECAGNLVSQSVVRRRLGTRRHSGAERLAKEHPTGGVPAGGNRPAGKSDPASMCLGSGKRVRRFADLIKAIRSGEPIDETHPALQLTRDEVRSIAFHLKDFHKRNPRACRFLLFASATNSASRRRSRRRCLHDRACSAAAAFGCRAFGGNGSRMPRSAPARR